MNIITKKISELKPYGNNPKIHTEKQIEQIAKSIELTKGLRQPIVIDKNNDDRKYFEKTFTFPIEKKQQITNYLKKHIQEITEEIIRKASE